MSEEIKEILEIFKKINEEYSIDTELDFEDYEIPNIYLKQFLDYITNLQEENIRLKELCDKYEEEHKTTFEYWKHLIKEDYKTRIDKAIEYINKHCVNEKVSKEVGYKCYTMADTNELEHLIRILEKKKQRNKLGE